MYINRRLALVFAITLIFTSCGGGEDLLSSGAGGSGIGGTGITVVKGNIASVNGQGLTDNNSAKETYPAYPVVRWVVMPSFAQSNISSGITVTGGGQSSTVNQFGDFVLTGVNANPEFVLRFSVAGSADVLLPIGSVPAGSSVTVRNISINTATNSAQSEVVEIEASVTSPVESSVQNGDDGDDGTSADSDNESETEDSTDQDSEDPDDPEDPEDSEDSADQDSEDPDDPEGDGGN